MQAAAELPSGRRKLSTVRGAWRMRVRRSKLPPTTRLVAYTLLEFMDESGECYARIATLCKASGLGRTAMKEHLNELVRRRYVRRERTDGRFSWTFFARLDPRRSSRDPQGSAGDRRGAPRDRRQSGGDPRTGVSNRGLEPKEKLSAAPDPEPDADVLAEARERAKAQAAAALRKAGSRPLPKVERPSQLEKFTEQRQAHGRGGR